MAGVTAPGSARFRGRVAIVTGAASGIGRATALRLAAEGARVACADLQAEGLTSVVKEIEAAGGSAAAFACDVTDEASVGSAVSAVALRFGGIDVVANVAGILRVGHSHEMPLAEWSRVLAVNLTGTFLVSRTAMPHLVASRGAIVNMASTAALDGHPWTAAYSASKGGVVALTRELAVEYGRQGVRVNAVCAGAVKTPIHASFHVPEGADRSLLERILPFTSFCEPEDVAAAVAFLASDEARHVNGTTLRVDAGGLA